MTVYDRIEELPNLPYRLGRHRHRRLTWRSRAAARRVCGTQAATVTHQEHEPAFDQGRLGSCTANAALGLLVTAPFWNGTRYGEQDAIDLYHQETVIGGGEVYPPDDPGSTGPISMQALRQDGRIGAYRATRDTDTLLGMLAAAPVSIGIPWLRCMFTVTAGRIAFDPASPVAGGHEIALVGCDTASHTVRVRNSWGTEWGQDGHADLAWGALRWLMEQGGDAVQPIL